MRWVGRRCLPRSPKTGGLRGRREPFFKDGLLGKREFDHLRTLSNLKIWSNVQSTGVADNLLNDLPTHTFDFTDVPAVNEKATITNVQIGTRFEETDSLKVF